MKYRPCDELHAQNVEAAIRLAQLSIEDSQKILAVLAALARELIDISADAARRQATAADLQELTRQRVGYVQQTMQQLMECALRMAEISQATRAKFSRLLTEQLASGSQVVMDSFQRFFKVLPAQNADTMTAMEQALASSSSAFEQIALVSSATANATANAAGNRGRRRRACGNGAHSAAMGAARYAVPERSGPQ